MATGGHTLKYSRFEILAFTLGTLAIVASLFVSTVALPQAPEVAAQLLLILVLAAALHWGRNGGFLAALAAIALYVGMRFSLLAADGLSRELLTMLGARVGTYSIVGIVGGELASRIKYLFAKMESDALIDHLTGVYSPRYAAESILSGLAQYERYQVEYCVVKLVVDGAAYGSLKPVRYRQAMKQLAGHLRADIRMVDDLAFAAPGTFLAVLPTTPVAGAHVVAERLKGAACTLLGVTNDTVSAGVLSASSTPSELRALARTLSPSTIESHEQRHADKRRSGVLGVSEAAETAQEPIS